jgi:hypothetical protein
MAVPPKAIIKKEINERLSRVIGEILINNMFSLHWSSNGCCTIYRSLSGLPYNPCHCNHQQREKGEGLGQPQASSNRRGDCSAGTEAQRLVDLLIR